jgi:DNA-binding NarL/FixJ family response regulator
MIGSMSGSVLVVDDDPGFLRVARQILDHEGVTVIATAATAAAGLAAAHQHRPEAALVDIGLPDRDGIDLGHELASLPWSPRVVLTSSDSDAAGFASRGALPFVPKEDLPTAPLRELLTG